MKKNYALKIIPGISLEFTLDSALASSPAIKEHLSRV